MVSIKSLVYRVRVLQEKEPEPWRPCRAVERKLMAMRPRGEAPGGGQEAKPPEADDIFIRKFVRFMPGRRSDFFVNLNQIWWLQYTVKLHYNGHG